MLFRFPKCPRAHAAKKQLNNPTATSGSARIKAVHQSAFPRLQAQRIWGKGKTKIRGQSRTRRGVQLTREGSQQPLQRKELRCPRAFQREQAQSAPSR